MLKLFAFSFLYAISSVTANAQTVWASTNSTGAVTGYYANAAPVPTPPGCCTTMLLTDPRVIAFLNTPTPQQNYAAALASGIQITSTSTPALNGIYSVDAGSQNFVSGIASSIGAGSGLPGGGATFQYLDMTGVPHTFTSSQFLLLAVAVRNYVYLCVIAQATGIGGVWPSNAITIP